MAVARPRPLSPHLTVFRWRPNMAVSILHRVTGNAMAFGAVMIFLWWLVAAATGAEAYATFYKVATGWFGLLVGIGFTWTFFQHLCSGLRHLAMDTGAAMEPALSRRLAASTVVASVVLTLATWAYILAAKGII